jgi:hypothetical protein
MSTQQLQRIDSKGETKGGRAIRGTYMKPFATGKIAGNGVYLDVAVHTIAQIDVDREGINERLRPQLQNLLQVVRINVDVVGAGKHVSQRHCCHYTNRSPVACHILPRGAAQKRHRTDTWTTDRKARRGKHTQRGGEGADLSRSHCLSSRASY